MPEAILPGAERRTRIWRRSNRLRALGFEDYDTYIASGTWAKTRAAYWSDMETPKTCAICGSEEKPLVLHHRTYERVGCEQLTDLVPVCPPCHRLAHTLEARGDIELDEDLEAAFDPERSRKFVAPAGCDPRRLRILGYARPRIRSCYERLGEANVSVRSRRTIRRNLRRLERTVEEFNLDEASE